MESALLHSIDKFRSWARQRRSDIRINKTSDEYDASLASSHIALGAWLWDGALPPLGCPGFLQ